MFSRAIAGIEDGAYFDGEEHHPYNRHYLVEPFPCEEAYLEEDPCRGDKEEHYDPSGQEASNEVQEPHSKEDALL